MSGETECIFCKVIRGEISSSKVYEDEVCMCFMDIFPVTEGHCLVVPKEHHINLLDVDLDVLAHLSKVVAEITRKVHIAFEPEGILTLAASGPGAGQEIPHLHFHIIPRNSGDDFGFRFPKDYREKMADREELDSTAKRISEC